MVKENSVSNKQQGQKQGQHQPKPQGSDAPATDQSTQQDPAPAQAQDVGPAPQQKSDEKERKPKAGGVGDTIIVKATGDRTKVRFGRGQGRVATTDGLELKAGEYTVVEGKA
jgi:hypothetical protein